jgi:dihydrofolate reductase
MRKLAVNTFTTLDGVMQAPGGPEEDTSGGFTYGGWSVNYWDEAMGQTMDAMTSKPFDLLLGRKTYEIFAAHWPRVTDDHMATALNGATKHVASRTLESVEWQNSRLLTGDIAEAVAKLKSERGPDIQIHGSGNLIQTLLRHDLIDEFRVWIFPLVLGTGKRLFAESTVPAGLKLRDSKTSSSGVIITVFERAGAIDYGSFALDEAT